MTGDSGGLGGLLPGYRPGPPRIPPAPRGFSPRYSLPTSVSSVASGGQAKRTGV